MNSEYKCDFIVTKCTLHYICPAAIVRSKFYATNAFAYNFRCLDVKSLAYRFPYFFPEIQKKLETRLLTAKKYNWKNALLSIIIVIRCMNEG